MIENAKERNRQHPAQSPGALPSQSSPSPAQQSDHDGSKITPVDRARPDPSPQGSTNPTPEAPQPPAMPRAPLAPEQPPLEKPAPPTPAPVQPEVPITIGVGSREGEHGGSDFHPGPIAGGAGDKGEGHGSGGERDGGTNVAFFGGHVSFDPPNMTSNASTINGQNMPQPNCVRIHGLLRQTHICLRGLDGRPVPIQGLTAVRDK